jgi:hypothetical protein
MLQFVHVVRLEEESKRVFGEEYSITKWAEKVLEQWRLIQPSPEWWEHFMTGYRCPQGRLEVEAVERELLAWAKAF